MNNTHQPFGSELRFLNDTIHTASNQRFSLARKPIIKFILRYFGVPHFGTRLRAHYITKIVQQFPERLRILDAGCGLGANSFMLAKHGHTVVGIDNNPWKLKLANKMNKVAGYTSVSFVPSDITRLPFPTSSFDAVVCTEVLEHIPDDRKAVKELVRVLKKDGFLLLSTPGVGYINKLRQKPDGHVRVGYTKENLEALCRVNSMQVIQFEGTIHTPFGLLVSYINHQASALSLGLGTALFPILFPLALLDNLLPSVVAPTNVIILARKK